MNKSQFLRTEGMVDRYISLGEKVQNGYTSQDVKDLSELCYDMVRVISDLRYDYQTRKLERRLRKCERTK